MTETYFEAIPAGEGSRPLRAGILGCGWFGGVHAERLSRIQGVHVAAVCDKNPDAMARIIEMTAEDGRPPGGVAQFTDYRRMTGSGCLDFLVVCSPDALHVQHILGALEDGLHVLSEKPLTSDPADVQRVVDAARVARRLVSVTYPFRYRPSTRALRSAIHSGKWGRVTSITALQQENWLTPNIGTWRHDPALCPGGCFADANGHANDAILWATGLRAAWVRATVDYSGTPVPICTWGEARLVAPGAAADDGVPMTFTYIGAARTWKDHIVVTTEGADFVMSGDVLLFAADASPLRPFPESESDPEILAYPSDPDRAFLAELRGGPPTLCPPETVLPVIYFTLAGLESAANGGAPRRPEIV